MCEPKPETTLLEEIRKVKSSLMSEDAVIEGAEDELFMVDKYVWVNHAYEHLRAVEAKTEAIIAPKCCDCGQRATHGVRCEECFFNTAIEGEDYVLHNGRVFIAHD